MIGQTPLRNWSGRGVTEPVQLLAEGWRGVMCQVRGDRAL